jgi:hypothetical protein
VAACRPCSPPHVACWCCCCLVSCCCLTQLWGHLLPAQCCLQTCPPSAACWGCTALECARGEVMTEGWTSCTHCTQVRMCKRTAHRYVFKSFLGLGGRLRGDV